MIERLLPLAASLLARTLRFRWTGDPVPSRCVIIFWHGTMFAGWFAARASNPIALVSQSNDGRLLASVLKRWGYKLVRGSSGKNGMEALQSAIEAMRQDVSLSLVITPDGPRGPRHVFKRGAFLAATELDVPLYMLRIHCRYNFRFKRSWDKFELPLPFSRVDVDSQPIDLSSFPVTDVDAQRRWLESASNIVSD